MRTLTDDEIKMIWVALNMRNNYIETGDVTLSAADAKQFNEDKKINALSDDQMRLILASRDMINKVIQGKIFITE
jgi:hypothetical protein